MPDDPPSRKKTLWSRARELSERTPDTRNRYVDFLRAASITVVVIGHWMMAAAFVTGGTLQLSEMLSEAPWTQWLTWVFQVMPIFFIVGGYSNGISWEAARRDGRDYGFWIGARLRRLLGPLLPLVLTWSVMAMIAHRLGVPPQTIKIGSQAALIPTWFLAVYIMVVVTAPVTHGLWRRFGMASFGLLVLAAAGVDALAFMAGVSWLRWLNYALVWLGVHHLGYVWRDGKIRGVGRAGLWAAAGFGVLVFLVAAASYPVSMITVPGDAVSNSRPPTFAMFALGIFQFGVVLTLRGPFRRWLRHLRPWTATVLVNGTIMTLYLWHLTVMILILGVVHLLGDVGLGLRPGTWAWWGSRPIWLAIYAAVLAVFVAVFGRFEQTARKGAAASVPPWRAIVGGAGVCGGIAMLALNGIGAEGLLGIRVGSVAWVLVGAALVVAPPRRVGR